MNFFKLPKKRIDERIENVRNKIYKEILHIISAICLGSMFLKIFILDMGTEAAVLELLILFVSGVYFLARSIFLGVYWDEVELHDRNSKIPMSNKTIFTSVGLSLLIAILMGINSAVSYADSTSQGLWYFVLVLLVSIMIYLPILFLLFGGIYFVAKEIGMKNNKE
ncbi:MAG TPA: DUF6773 family protein [Chondromyces sp.]|nr:DUF6773 family protein [Chondromyces sp.]